MALTKVTNGGITDSAITSAKIDDGSIINADIKSDAAITASKLSATLDLSSKTVTLPSASVTAHATTPTLDSPSITGTLFVDSGSTVSHTISNWSDDVTYVITPTNCTVGSITTSGVFVVTHTSGTPSYTIKATTTSLGLDDSALVTKNIVVNLSAPTISSPADNTVSTNVVYTVTSTDSNDDKIILDMGTSSFTLGTVSPGSGTKVGNTVEVTGFTTGNPVITVQFTALGTYASVKAKSTKIDASYGDSAYSSTDSILIYEQLSAPSLNAPADSDDATAVTYTISSINANATKVIFDAQSSNFTYGSVGSGSGSKVGNTVEITGWTGTSVTVTLTYTTAATYSNRAKVTNSANAVYTDSAYSSTDSIVISASVLINTYGASFNGTNQALWKNDFGTKSSANTWTLSYWIKNATLANGGNIFATNDGCYWGTGYVYHRAAHILNHSWYNNCNYNNDLTGLNGNTSWSHIMWVVSAGTANLYYNGSVISSANCTSISNYANFLPSQTTVMCAYYENGTCASGAGGWVDVDLGYMVFLDGTAESVGTFRDTSTGAVKGYTGSSFGTNGFVINFADSSDMGKDVSGQGNHWSSGNSTSQPSRITW